MPTESPPGSTGWPCSGTVGSSSAASIPLCLGDGEPDTALRNNVLEKQMGSRQTHYSAPCLPFSFLKYLGRFFHGNIHSWTMLSGFMVLHGRLVLSWHSFGVCGHSGPPLLQIRCHGKCRVCTVCTCACAVTGCAAVEGYMHLQPCVTGTITPTASLPSISCPWGGGHSLHYRPQIQAGKGFFFPA